MLSAGSTDSIEALRRGPGAAGGPMRLRWTESPTSGPTAARRVLIVSNRLPLTVSVEDGAVTVAPSVGGLATGLGGVHERSRGRWIGWSGVPADRVAGARGVITRHLNTVGAVDVPLTCEEIAGYYEGFANGVLWPALHDMPADAAARATDWATYQAVNARFADAVAREARPGDLVWVHDYHLMLVPALLRARCPDVRVGFFLHTPFPSLGAITALPQRRELLRGLLGADVIGVHTPSYAAGLAAAVRAVLGLDATDRHVTADDGREVHVHACPMSIDVGNWESLSRDRSVERRVREVRGDVDTLFVGVDRLDYTKGIPERIAAFAQMLERAPGLRGRVRLLQIAAPSRVQVPAYQALRTRVESLVRSVNRRFGTAQWTPIEYVYDTVVGVDLAALYRAADVLLVTPRRDGMNLVAKEFVASRTDGDGVLVLSRHAGAAAELRAALLVDPADVAGLADAYETAAAMPRPERRVRMRRLRSAVRRHDVFAWARELLLVMSREHAALVGRTAG